MIYVVCSSCSGDNTISHGAPDEKTSATAGLYILMIDERRHPTSGNAYKAIRARWCPPLVHLATNGASEGKTTAARVVHTLSSKCLTVILFQVITTHKLSLIFSSYALFNMIQREIIQYLFN